MATGASDTDKDQLNMYNGVESGALGNYNSDIGSYNSNINSTLAAGNPYASQPYLENQNIATSGAMNAANTREGQQLRDTTRRAGTNTAAIAGTIADSARTGQRDLTQYNATQANENEDKWLNEQQGLFRDQLAGANSEAGVYGTAVGGANNATSNYTSAENAQDEMWGQIISAGEAGAGAGAGAAFHG
ncbi:MAG TPA: hypothetical protein VGG42_09790 [Acidobacteriaceae bacterium]|jgi:hypothetical protein